LRIVSYRDTAAEDLLTRAERSGMSAAELSQWHAGLGSARVELCGCRPAGIAAASSSFVSVALIAIFVEERYVSAIAAAVVCTITITLAAKLIGHRRADRRLAALHKTLRSRIAELETI
jgi:hypothetical protein